MVGSKRRKSASAVKTMLSPCGLRACSRGGKLSSLVAGKDPRVKGLLLLDPVDNTPMTPAGKELSFAQEPSVSHCKVSHH